MTGTRADDTYLFGQAFTMDRTIRDKDGRLDVLQYRVDPVCVFMHVDGERLSIDHRDHCDCRLLRP